MSEVFPPKTPQELGISEHDWILLAESLIFSREFAALLPYCELSIIHRMNIDHLEEYFGIRPKPTLTPK